MFNLSLIKLSLWPIRTLGKIVLPAIDIDKIEENSDVWQKKSLFKYSLKTFPAPFIFRLLLDLSLFSISIWISILLSKIVDLSSPRIFTYVYILAALFFLRWLFGFLSIYLYGLIEKRNNQFLCCTMINTAWVKTEKSLLHQLAGRDVNIFLDACVEAHKPMYCLISFLIATGFVFVKYGFLGFIALASLVFFIPLSAYLTKKMDAVNQKVLDISKQRLQATSKWIDWWFYALNWKEKKPFDQIVSLSFKEIKLRSIDSFWKGLDTYIICFGRIIPVIIMSIPIIAAASGEFKNTEILWVSIPLINLIMGFPRAFVEYKNGNRSFLELRKKFLSLNQTETKKLNKEIYVDSSWEIWHGDLKDNILFVAEHTDFILSLLNLDKEFINNTSPSFSRVIEPFGTNISAGQKIRVILARAANIAIHNKMPIHINISLDSLDIKNVERIEKLVSFINKFVSTHYDPKLFYRLNITHDNECMSYQEIDTYNSDSNNKKTISSNLLSHANKKIIDPFWKQISAWLFPVLPLFFIPAAGLAMLGSSSYKSGQDFNSLLSLISIAIISLIWIVVVGVFVEWRIRKWAFLMIQHILLKLHNKQKTDVLQKLSKDFQTVIEKIAWYTHDLGWIIALLSIATIGVLSKNPIYGLGVFVIFYIICIILWYVFIPSISYTRKASIIGFNSFLKEWDNLFCSSNLLNISLNHHLELRQKQAYKGFNELFRTRLELNITKGCLSNFSGLAVGFLFISTCLIIIFSHTSALYAAFLLTAILSVDNEIFRLFLALSGYKSQYISIERLRETEKEQPYFNARIISLEQSFMLRGGENGLLGTKYKNIQLSKGGCFTLFGPSGQGKTQYLKYLIGLNNQEEYNDKNNKFKNEINECVLYLDKEMPFILEWLQCKNSLEFIFTSTSLKNFIGEKLKIGFKIIILDETLISLDVNFAKEIIQEIESEIIQHQALLILVDHRFITKNRINIQDLFL